MPGYSPQQAAITAMNPSASESRPGRMIGFRPAGELEPRSAGRKLLDMRLSRPVSPLSRKGVLLQVLGAISTVRSGGGRRPATVPCHAAYATLGLRANRAPHRSQLSKSTAAGAAPRHRRSSQRAAIGIARRAVPPDVADEPGANLSTRKAPEGYGLRGRVECPLRGFRASDFPLRRPISGQRSPSRWDTWSSAPSDCARKTWMQPVVGQGLVGSVPGRDRQEHEVRVLVRSHRMRSARAYGRRIELMRQRIDGAESGTLALPQVVASPKEIVSRSRVIPDLVGTPRSEHGNESAIEGEVVLVMSMMTDCVLPSSVRNAATEQRLMRGPSARPAGLQFFTRKVPVTLFVFGSMTETPPTKGRFRPAEPRRRTGLSRRPLRLFDPVLGVDIGVWRAFLEHELGQDRLRLGIEHRDERWGCRSIVCRGKDVVAQVISHLVDP